jgi:hypothetical protein
MLPDNSSASITQISNRHFAQHGCRPQSRENFTTEATARQSRKESQKAKGKGQKAKVKGRASETLCEHGNLAVR